MLISLLQPFHSICILQNHVACDKHMQFVISRLRRQWCRDTPWGVRTLSAKCLRPCPAHRAEPPDSFFQSFACSGLTQLLLDSLMQGGHSRKGPSSYSLWWQIGDHLGEGVGEAC